MKDLKTLVEQYMDAIPRRDFGMMRQMLHSQYSFTGSDGHRQEGADAGIAVTEMYINAFPDMTLEIKHMNVAGDTVVTEFTAHGTHKGELMGIEPTNRRVAIPVCNITEFRDGKIIAEREYFDAVFMMQQLGVEVGHAHA